MPVEVDGARDICAALLFFLWAKELSFLIEDNGDLTGAHSSACTVSFSSRTSFHLLAVHMLPSARLSQKPVNDEKWQPWTAIALTHSPGIESPCKLTNAQQTHAHKHRHAHAHKHWSIQGRVSPDMILHVEQRPAWAHVLTSCYISEKCVAAVVNCITFSRKKSLFSSHFTFFISQPCMACWKQDLWYMYLFVLPQSMAQARLTLAFLRGICKWYVLCWHVGHHQQTPSLFSFIVWIQQCLWWLALALLCLW